VIGLLQRGTQLLLPRHGGAWRVGDLLGEGGQGAVFELESVGRERANTLALKWYRPEAAHPDQHAALTRLARLPAPSEAFLWPIEIIDGQEGGFGYVMPIRPPEFLPLADLLTGRADASFSTVTKLCMGLADSFLKLHAQGLCYRDISLGNVFFDPTSGRPLVCDNDNVGIDGREPARVLGTSRFMAPEVVRGDAQPSTATDLFSLAVLIFYLLMFHHPLQGRRELAFACFDRDAERQLFGTDPLFIFDPADESNAPDPVIHGAVLEYWPLYPPFLRDDFIRAFTVGLTNPAQRVREGVWRSHLSRLLDGIVICSCGRENLTDDGVPMRPCWSCGNEIAPPVRLRFGPRVLVLNAGARVTRHHLLRDYDYDQVVGEVVAHPSRPGLWGLRNLTKDPWRATAPDGTEQEVVPGRSIGLMLGTRIDFGRATGILEG
jgi:DNA-binding helix-hairpin-helix protein with protein kinase domain